MTDRPATAEPSLRPKKPRFPRWPLLIVAGFVLLIHGAWWLIGDQIVAKGNLADGDAYTRMVRIERLVDTGAWFDNTLPRAGAPAGVTIHWTRPLDAAVIALGLPLMPVLGVKTALYWAGAVVSPLMHLLAALALVWAATPFLGRAGALIAGALTATQFGILPFAIIGRADHHAVFGLTVFLTLGFMARAFIDPPGRRPLHNFNALMTGVMLAFGFWMGPETIILLGMVFAATGLAWVAGEEAATRRNLFASLGLASGLMVMVLVEKGFGDFLLVEYDRLSIVHVTLALLLLAFWAGVGATHRVWRRAGAGWRMVFGVFGAAFVALVLRFLFAGLLLNPLTDVDPVVLKIFNAITEYGPIDDIPRFLFYVGSIVFAAPWVVRQAKINWTSRHRWTWLVIAAALFVYTGLAVTWVRWSLYAGFILALVIADLIVHADGAIDRRFTSPRRTVVKVAVILFIVIGPVLAGMAGLSIAGASAGEDADKTAAGPRCAGRDLARFLNRPEWAGRPRTIVASANFGAEILYRTNHKVVATVSHRNTAGVYDGYRIFSGKDEAAVLEILRRRKADLLVLCPESSHDGYFLTAGKDGTFYQRLVSGDFPDWVREVPLPGKTAEGFRLFEVRR